MEDGIEPQIADGNEPAKGFRGESADTLKRRELFKRTGILFLGATTATAAVEAVPLPAEAQHVIGMAIIAQKFAPKIAVSVSRLKRGIVKRASAKAMPTPLPMHGFVYLATTPTTNQQGQLVPNNPFTDPNFVAFYEAELTFLAGAAYVPKYIYLLAGTSVNGTPGDNPLKFGYDGQFGRYGSDNSGSGKNGNPFFWNDKEQGQAAQYYDVWLGIYAT